MSLDYVSNQEIIQAARRNLPQDVWDYLTGGAESEQPCVATVLVLTAWDCARGCWWTFQRSTRQRRFWGRSYAFPLCWRLLVHCKRSLHKAVSQSRKPPPNSGR